MILRSAVFIILFLPICCLTFFIIPNKIFNYFLLAQVYYFMNGAPWFDFIVILNIISYYSINKAIDNLLKRFIQENSEFRNLCKTSRVLNL